MAELLLACESIEGGAGARDVAIKVIRGEFAEDGEFAKMFLNEGRLAMRLTHPNICTVYECGRHAGRFFMAMEFVHGQTLRDVLVRAAKRGQSLPVPVLMKMFAVVAEALDFAHRAKDAQGRPLHIVHRDVSPHNVMVRYDGVVKLLDFGVAKAERSSHSTESGALKGKFSYMSPEQALGHAIDSRADVFSLGVCIFESITGRRLFHRKAQYETLKATLESDPPPLSAFRDDIPDGLEKIVRRALAKKPEDRYQRAGDLHHDLEALLTEMREVVGTSRIAEVMEGLFAEEIRRGPLVDAAEDLRERYAAVVPVEEPKTLPPPPMRARAPWIAALVGALVLLGGSVTWLLASGDDEGAAPADTRAASPAPPDPAAAAADPSDEAPPAEEQPAATSDAPSLPVDSPADERPAEATADPSSPSGSEDATLGVDSTEEQGEPDQERAPTSTEAADEDTEEAPSARSTRGNRSRTPHRGRHNRRRRHGRGRRGGTVIVTDPGF